MLISLNLSPGSYPLYGQVDCAGDITLITEVLALGRV